jgi:two-component system sensor histidine kinase VicK
MLRDGTIDSFDHPTKSKFYDGAWAKCQKLEDIINDILNATSLVNRKYNVMDKDVEPINLKTFFEKMISEFEPETREREINLTLAPFNEIIPEIYGQKQYLEEAFTNLVTNAIKYTPSPKKTADIRDTREGEAKIIINVEKNGNDVIISVRDNGIGIPKEAMPKLFQKFSRAENARNMYTDGTGLGLFIIKEIVEGHGGKVWVESEEGKGSTFFVELPINSQKKIDIKEYIKEKASA